MARFVLHPLGAPGRGLKGEWQAEREAVTRDTTGLARGGGATARR